MLANSLALNQKNVSCEVSQSTKAQYSSDGMNTEIRNNLSISITKTEADITILSVNHEEVNRCSLGISHDKTSGMEKA